MTIKIIVANDKGGVGKSTLAQMCVLHLGRAFGEVRAVEYDRQPKLGRFFEPGAVQTFSIAPDWHAQLTQPRRVAEYWDPMIKWLTVQRPLVADFGAQAWDYFAHWAADSSLGELVDTSRVVVLVPVTADLEAIGAAQRILDTVPGLMPAARMVLLSCDKDGEMALLGRHPALTGLMASAAARKVPMRSLPTLAAEGYPALAAFGLRFDTICAATPRDLLSRAGLPPAVAVRTIKAVRAWVAGMEALLAGIVGERAGQPPAVTAAQPGAEPSAQPGAQPQTQPQQPPQPQGRPLLTAVP